MKKSSLFFLFALISVAGFSPVSYTHLDVYKRQELKQLLEQFHFMIFRNLADHDYH